MKRPGNPFDKLYATRPRTQSPVQVPPAVAAPAPAPVAATPQPSFVAGRLAGPAPKYPFGSYAAAVAYGRSVQAGAGAQPAAQTRAGAQAPAYLGSLRQVRGAGSARPSAPVPAKATVVVDPRALPLISATDSKPSASARRTPAVRGDRARLKDPPASSLAPKPRAPSPVTLSTRSPSAPPAASAHAAPSAPQLGNPPSPARLKDPSAPSVAPTPGTAFRAPSPVTLSTPSPSAAPAASARAAPSSQQ